MLRLLSWILQVGCLTTLMLPAAGAALTRGTTPPVQQSLKADLDGDGVAETITLATVKGLNGDQGFTLTVNSVSVKRKLDTDAEIKIQIVDIDGSDSFKEVVVTAAGEDDFTTTFAFRYDGKQLIELLKLDGAGIDFSGNGIALRREWMGFWTRKRKYQLDRAAQRFNEVPQELYYVGIEGKVNQTFAVYERRADSAVVANTRAGSAFLVVACDPSPRCPGAAAGTGGDACHWYLIKTESGLLGWVRLSTLRDKAALPWAG